MKKKIYQILLLLALALPSLGAESYDYQRGDEAYYNGNYDEAIEYYIKDLDANPSHVEGYTSLAACCREQGNLSKAIVALNMGKPYCKSKYHKWAYYGLMGEIQAMAGDTAAALDNYSQAIKIDPKNAKGYIGRGCLYYFQNKLALAETDLKKQAELRKYDIDSQTLLAMLYNKQERWNDVLTCLAKLDPADTTTSNYSRSDSYAFRANAYYHLNQYDKMADDYKHAVNIAGLSDRVCTIFREIAKSPSALNALVQQLKKQKFSDERKNGVLYFLIGSTYDKLDSLETAIDYYNKVLEYEESSTLRACICQDFYSLGFNDLLFENAKKVEETDSTETDICAIKVRTLRAIGKNKEALEVCNEMVRRSPDKYYVYYVRGFSYLKSGNFDAALADYNTALDLKPDSKYTHSERGDLYRMMGDTAKARLDYLVVIDGPQVEEEEIDTVTLMFSLYYLGRQAEAEKYATKLLAGNDRSDILNVASLYDLMGKTDAAFSALKLALEKGYRQMWLIENDKDFANVRKLPGFKPLIDEYKQKLQQEEADYRAKHNLPAKTTVTSKKSATAKSHK